MAEADPGAWRELALACPDCGDEWSAPFDVVRSCGAELDACALRLSVEVARARARVRLDARATCSRSAAGAPAAYLELAGA